MRRQSRSLSLGGTITLCLLSGLLLGLAFPPVGIWPLAWIALVPWLVALRTGTRLGAVIGSWLAGVTFFGMLLYWMQLFGLSVWILLAVLLGTELLIWGLFVRGVNRLRPAARPLGIAALWVAVEWLRGLGPLGFPWGWLGYSQSPAVPILPIVRYLGVLGLSFFIVFINAALAEVLAARVRRGNTGAAMGRAVLACALVAIIFGVAGLRLRSRTAASTTLVRAAVIQGSARGPLTVKDVNHPPAAEEQQQTLDLYQSMTEKAARQGPALVVWPESTLSTPPETDPRLTARLTGIAKDNATWLLVGGPYVDQTGQLSNSAYLYAPTGNLRSRYDKVQLVPFGEYVPAREHLPFINHYNVRKQDFVAGTSHSVFQATTMALGPMICFESAFPQISWELVNKGAQVLVVITNDAWFGHTAAAAQHEQVSAMRAAETGRWVLQAASTGVSALIAPDGRVVKHAGLYQQATLVNDVALASTPVPGVTWGPIFAWSTVGLGSIYIIMPLFVRDRASRRPVSPARKPARAAKPKKARPGPRPSRTSR